MSILSTIAEKIKPTQPTPQDNTLNEPSPAAASATLTEKQSSLQILEKILEEVKKISGIVTTGKTEEGRKPKRVEKEVKREPLAERVEKPTEEAAKKDAEKVTKKPSRKKKKEPAPSPFVKSAEAPVSAAPTEAPAPPPPQEDKKGILDGLIETLKSLFLPIIAVGGIGAFLSGMFTMILEGLGMGEEGGFFDTLTKTVKTITKPIIWTFENVIKPVGTIILTALKEFALGIGQMWNEAKLMLMGDSLVAKGIRYIFKMDVDKKEKEELEKKVYEGRMRKEQRMAGYVEAVTGRRPGAPAQPPPRRVEIPPPIYLGTRTAIPPPSLVPAPIVTKPAPPPAAKPAAPPPAAKPAAPPPAAPPPAAKPAAPPPAAAPAARPPATAPSVTPTSPGEFEGIDVKAMVIKHEGKVMKPYKDSLGLWTVGVGHLIGDGKSLPPEWNRTFTEAEVMALFDKDFEHHKDAAEKIPAYNKISGRGKAALIDLTFNMGPTWWKKWPNLMKQLQAGDMQGAAKNLAESTWASQVKSRAGTIISLVQNSTLVAGGGGTMVAQAPTTGQAVNVASAEVNSEKNRSRQPAVNVTYVDATKVTTATKTVYS
jgi:GH24 family phage-related lysozyme (muramidase)